MRALISIHDVMPETLSQVRSILQEIPRHCHANLTLLVVPGRAWSAADIDQLRAWQAEGYLLAGHGWYHEAGEIRSLYHKAHSRLLSRRAAEHLALSRSELVELLQRNHAWFADQGLATPDYYVPPAWAMGHLDTADLAQAPFRFFENLGGLYDSSNRSFRALPLVGFEADTRWRKWSLGTWNSVSRLFATRRHPLRIAIHPPDGGLLLAAQLRRMLDRVQTTLHYRELFPALGGAAQSS